MTGTPSRIVMGAMALVLMAMSLSGCVAVGKRFVPVADPDPAKALVYFYRPHPRANVLLTNTYSYVHAADVFIDDEKTVSLNVNAYTYVELAPGSYTFSMRDNLVGGPLATLEVEVVANQEYFCRYDFNFVPLTEFALSVVPHDVAEEEISKTRFVPALGESP